tara:strand:- start:2044 stop:2541 length:498 start_codon:yes stop_codon:yes gene_type:complete
MNLFWSHAWACDEQLRNNHERVIEMASYFQKAGFSSWIDEWNMYGDLDDNMSSGIDDADVVLICITKKYSSKLSAASRTLCFDNCYKEWTYAIKRNKIVLPIVMEPCMRNQKKWSPILVMNLGSRLYIDASESELLPACLQIQRVLKRLSLSNKKKKRIEVKYWL